MKPSFAVVGCGKVGTALAIYLNAAGYRAAGVASISLASAKQTARTIGSDRFGDRPWEITPSAEVVFITTPDGAIADTCEALSRNRGFAPGSVVLHCSGALPSTILSAAKTCGAHIGSMHPLQSFASKDYTANPFQGIIISLEGEDRAIETAASASADLGGTCVTIRTQDKTLYHAAAVTASNYLVALLDLALELIGAAGVPAPDRFAVLKPLIEGTLSNIGAVGIPDALTGPIVRGDVETVTRHIEEIERKTPELLDIYKALGFHTVGVAQARGTLSEAAVRQLKALLEKGAR